MAKKALALLLGLLLFAGGSTGCKIETPQQHQSAAGGLSSCEQEAPRESVSSPEEPEASGEASAPESSFAPEAPASGGGESRSDKASSRPASGSPAQAPGTQSSSRGEASSSVPPAPPSSASEPEKQLSCIFSIDAKTAIASDVLPEGYRAVLPENGVLFTEKKVAITEGETVYDLLRRSGIPITTSGNAKYGSIYVQSIGGLPEKVCGPRSGWNYLVNGKILGTGCSKYKLKDGDRVQWRYTCDLGMDLA